MNLKPYIVIEITDSVYHGEICKVTVIDNDGSLDGIEGVYFKRFCVMMQGVVRGWGKKNEVYLRRPGANDLRIA